MSRRWRCTVARHVLAVLLAALPGAQIAAQDAAKDERRTSRLDVVADDQRVSGGFGDWRGVTLRLVSPTSSLRTVWYADARWQRAFGDEGAYFSLAASQSISRDWYAFVSAGIGTGNFVLPDARFDFSLSRKWLPGQQLVTSAGVTVVDGKRGYRDTGGYVSFAAYPAHGVVVEAGGRFNRSTPGDVSSKRAFGAITLGSERHHFLTIRGSTGGEGYQLLGLTTVVEKFASSDGSISWREWIGRAWGTFIQGERYTNTFYRRTGITLGLFLSW